MRCSGQTEDELRRQGYLRPAGVDEAGRGALFGAVYAAAVVLDPGRPVRGIADSKVLTAEQRCELSMLIKGAAASWAIGTASAGEVDRINVLQASRLAMRRAVEALDTPCDYLLVDAISIDWPLPQQGIIKGDATVRAIAAASILAKTARDAAMEDLDRLYPGYGIARHKGYPTAEHRDALRRLGPTPLHRMTFRPVQEALQAVL